MSEATPATPATPDNYLELMDALSVHEALDLARGIARRLRELRHDDDGYWLEKPWKFPHYWVPALNGTLDDDYLEHADDLDTEEED